MKTLTTCVDCNADFDGQKINVPAGTEIRALQCGGGIMAYYVASEKLVGELSGNAWRAQFYHAWVPDSAVKA